MSTYENAIEISNVSKRYKTFELDDISFTVPKGFIMGFIGQNGAGKTTTLHTMLNIKKTDEGQIKIFGLDHAKDEKEIKKRIAVVFDEMPFHDVFNIKDISKIFEGLYPEWDDAQFMKYAERFGLPPKQKIGQFSKGMKMKLQIACALSHNAELLVMDEATAGLDPVVRDEILHIFMEYMQNGERSVLMSSHITSDLEKIADMVTFIDRGKILLTGYKDDILGSHGILKCDKDEVKNIDPEDIVSIRMNDFGAEIMVKDRESAAAKYRNALIDAAGLDDIMVYYVHRDEKEWS